MALNKFIREPECFLITGLSRPTRWRLERDNKFPKRHKISQNTIGWLESDIEAWINSRVNNSHE
jgi:prophage regulatory protein